MVQVGRLWPEVGALETQVPAGWMAAARAGTIPSEPVGTQPSKEQTSNMMIERLGLRTCEGIHVTTRDYSLQLGSPLQMDHVVVVVTVGSRPKRVEPSGQLAEHCVDTLRGTMYGSDVRKRIGCFWQKRWGGSRTHRGL